MRLFAAAAAAGLVGSIVFTAAGATPALAAPDQGAATVGLAGAVSPAAPDADTVQTLTIPLTVTNTSDTTLYDLSVSSLRSAPITSRSALTTAFGGAAVEEGEFTKTGPRQAVDAPLAPGASTRVDYVVDTSNEDGTGICLCVLGVYALDVVVRAADAPDGTLAPVARTQTYLPSLLGVDRPEGVGWVWPLLERPHRLTPGSVFADDDLAASVGAGGRLDRALQVVEDVDAASAADPTVARSMLLLLDPEVLDELVTMTRGYSVTTATGTTTGTGETAAASWLARLAAVLPRHDVRTTLPADPDVVGLAARSVTPATTLGEDADARIAAALQLGDATLPPASLAWPLETDLDAAAYRALAATGATGVVTSAVPDDAGAATAVDPEGGATMGALVADPLLGEQTRAATGLGETTAAALQRLVVTAAMTSVTDPDESRYVAVVPDRDLDVDPTDAARAVLATVSLGVPVSPVAALAGAGTDDPRADLVATATSAPPAPLDTTLDIAGAAAQGADTVRAAVVGDAGGVVGDLADRVQLATSNGWAGHGDAAAPFVADLTAVATRFATAVQVVRTSGGYSLASADAPLLLTVANNLPVPVKVRIQVDAVGRSTGFEAAATETTIAANSRPTTKVPVSVTRSGRFDVAVTLSTAGGVPIGEPTPIVVTSTAVGTVGKIVTYGAGALLVLALLVRGVRRLLARSRAGSGGTGPDGDTSRPDPTRAEDPPTVPASTP